MAGRTCSSLRRAAETCYWNWFRLFCRSLWRSVPQIGTLLDKRIPHKAFKETVSPSPPPGMAKVTRWQVPPSEVLETTNWVQKGGKFPWNWVLSGKANPLNPAHHVPSRNDRTFTVSKKELVRPPGIEKAKIGQRKYAGEESGPPE